MEVVALNRRFYEWGDIEPPEPEFRRAMGLDEGGVGWDQLLAKRRVVVLAEAGSGKSTEIEERVRINLLSGRFTFKATVEDVGREGLEAALSHSGRMRLAEWRASTEDAWFFMDSVDEAKGNGIPFERVARKIADGIQGAEDRAHLVLTGRITDWEFRSDLRSFKEWLPVAMRDSAPPTTPDEELLRIIRQAERGRKKEPPSSEQPFVVLMAPLDRDRIRLFAGARSTPLLDRFIEQIDAANLWHFARRPLDLDWLVRYWQSEGRLGSLAEMVERGVFERLKETNTRRARRDALDSARACHAMERIGATMVFGRKSTIAIPDGDLTLNADSSLDLGEVLSDWSADKRMILLTRPIFDPATLGRARIHNDNEGVVRGYLAARWLARLRKANLPSAALFKLLFARSYGLDVVKPSLTETVGWLSLWDKDVADEVVRRQPSLLLVAGDPASIPPDIRGNALAGIVNELVTKDADRPWHNRQWWDNDQLRRFAQPDLGGTVAFLWPKCRGHNEAYQLLLRLVWLGALKECATIASDAVFDGDLDPLTRVFAGRALLETASEDAKKEYARYIIAECSTVPKEMIRDVIEQLFPKFIAVGDLLSILKSEDPSHDVGQLGLRGDGTGLASRLNSAAEIEQLLTGLLTQISTELGEHAHHPPTEQEKAYFPAIIAAAVRLLKVSAPENASGTAVDAVLRVGNRRNHDGEIEEILKDALAELHRTTQRRRFAFWRAAHSLRSASHERLMIESPWQMEMMGYQPGLQFEDVDWLLEDGLTRGEHDRRLAINAALAVYRSAGSPTNLREKIAAAASADPIATEAYNNSTQPPERSLQEIELERRLKRIENQNASATKKSDQSWINFVRDLRSDSARIDRLRVPASGGVNSDLYSLWRLLDAASGRSSYAINSVTPLVKIVGPHGAEAAREGLIAHWKSSPPLLKSSKEVTDRNSVRWVDLMGLVGVSLDAESNGWSESLSPEQATAAAGYATLELNGFPSWMATLTASKPVEVRNVLVTEITDELSRPGLTYYDTLNKVAYADERIASLVVPHLLDDLETGVPFPRAALSLVLRIIVRGIQRESTMRFIGLGAERFGKEADPDIAVQYLAAVFILDATASVRVLTMKLGAMSASDRAIMIDRFVSATFGGSMSGTALEPHDVTAEPLEQLVRLTFELVETTGERKRTAGKVYKLDEHDRANLARGAVFDRFAKTPGAFTFQALLRFQSDATCPIQAGTLRALAEDRAIQDSESEPWLPSQALNFEQDYETLPRTAKDLQTVLIHRIEDIQQALLHGDFAQGRTLSRLPDEVDVQNWLADRLRLRQGPSFSVEREPHVADEKEPDVRIRAKSTDVSVAIEIKIADSWTFRQLKEALEDQLCSRYLRAQDGRYGVLLLVHQNPRRKKWKDTTAGVWLSFPEVVARLSVLALLIAGAHPDSPQPEVCAIDVSACQTKTELSRGARPKKSNRRRPG